MPAAPSPAPAVHTPTVSLQDGAPPTLLEQALQDAYESALTKFDDLESYFNAGLKPPRVCEMLRVEMVQDLAALVEGGEERCMETFLAKRVGTVFGAWKRQGGITPAQPKQIKDVPLPWSSIEPYPEYIANQIQAYRAAEAGERAHARTVLEHTLLEAKLHAATVKLDGTCFGKMDTGNLVGRKQLLGPSCEAYQQTSTAAAGGCDVEALRGALALLLSVELPRDSVCAWGELMCNPGYYNYRERDLAGKWVCFGVVAALPAPSDQSQVTEWTQRLTAQGLAHSLSERGNLRLLLCPALRRLLLEVGRCELVAADVLAAGGTHAEMVARAAAGLAAGENEGLVLVFPSARNPQQASARKWKNSAEGRSVSQKHAQLLRGVDARGLANEGALDARIADMVETMIRVAEAETVVRKVGRRAAG